MASALLWTQGMPKVLVVIIYFSGCLVACLSGEDSEAIDPAALTVTGADGSSAAERTDAGAPRGLPRPAVGCDLDNLERELRSDLAGGKVVLTETCAGPRASRPRQARSSTASSLNPINRNAAAGR
jgi:hypothetical protein